MIPDFDEKGVLPTGIHEADSWGEIIEAFGGSRRRVELLVGLRRMLQALANAGCTAAYIDGSFVTDKEIPGDFDIAFELDGIDYALLPYLLLNFDTSSRRLQKIEYGGEALPNVNCADTGQLFVDFFQNDTVNGGRKGIVVLNPQMVLHD